jgi:WS/DGAT C-terminal domain/Wax ester synthase-like Acyl-CoA acyltransferase domain
LTGALGGNVVRRMAPVDAMWFWLAGRIPNDQFLLYAFWGSADDIDRAVAEVRERARSCPELVLRAHEPALALRHPEWIAGDVEPDQFEIHDLAEPSWQSCLGAIGDLMERQLDARVMTWRLHVFPGVHGVPGAAEPATVAVVQMSHALGDGGRVSALAAVLFGRGAPVLPVAPVRSGWVLPAAVDFVRQRRQLNRDTESGSVPTEPELLPPLSTNGKPAGARILHTITRHRSQMPAGSVTVGAMTAISEALSDHLRANGEDVSRLAAQVLMADGGERHAHNQFGNASVGLYPDVEPREERARRIAADMANWRRRHEHPAFAAQERVFNLVPAPLRRRKIARMDMDVQLAEVMGNTVISSVNRGKADLSFGGCPVFMTAGYPAIFPMMGITHGVHGIGDTVAVSVHTAESVFCDVDDYLKRLDAALRP